MSNRVVLVLLLLVTLALALGACGGAVAGPSGGAKPAANPIKLASAEQLPADLRGAPVEVQEAYRFAIANKELLEQIPCFCGCTAAGHKSNYNCYVAEDGGPGEVVKFDNHAAG